MALTEEQKTLIEKFINGDPVTEAPGVNTYINRFCKLREAALGTVKNDELGSTHPAPFDDILLAKAAMKNAAEAFVAFLS